MLNNKFYNLYKKLTKSEFVAFGEHLAGTHDESQHILKMYTYIARFHRDLPNQSKKLTHEKIHAAVFSDEPFEKKKILNLYYDLHQQLKLFLVRKELSQDKFETQRYWLNVLSGKNIQDRFMAEYVHLHDILNESIQKGTEYYRKSLIAQEIQYYQVEPYRKDHNAEAPLNYLKCLDTYHAICKMKIGCDMASLNYMVSSGKNQPERFDLTDIVQLSMQIDQKTLSDHPLLHLYTVAFRMLTTGEDQYFRQLVIFFEAYVTQIESVDLRKILTFLQNYISRQIKAGKKEYWPESFQLFKYAFNNGIYSQYGAISPTLFQNIVTISCNNQEFEWAERFIRQQGEFLDESSRHDTVLLAEAGVIIEKGDYDGARLKLDNKSEFKDPHHTIRAIMMLLFCDYMRDTDEDELEDRCVNFERFLIRVQKKHKITVQSYQKFSHILKMLLQKIDSVEVIRKEMDPSINITGRAWLETILKKYKPV